VTSAVKPVFVNTPTMVSVCVVVPIVMAFAAVVNVLFAMSRAPL
jgi:hypothetical protein